MSLTTVTITLDNKLRSLRNSSLDSELEIVDKNKKVHSQPLTLGENIPFADESPERPIIQTRSKPIRSFNENRLMVNRNDRMASQSTCPPNSPKDLISSRSESSQENVGVEKITPLTPGGVSSDETDASTTSNPREILGIDTEVLREMNRILTNLERKATKLNRSLSLNYKNHKGECCCNNNHRQSNRFSLTKDEKTDKNISKKRQLQDIKNHRRHTAGNRSIKRRHTVGGTHDYSTKNPNNHDPNTPCQGYVSTRTSSPDLVTKNDEIHSSHQEQENCHH